MAMGNLLKGLRGGGSAAPSRGASGAIDVDALFDTSPERRLGLLEAFEASGDGWVWESDASGKLTYLSGEAAQAVGLPAEVLSNANIVDLFQAESDVGEGGAGRSLRLITSAQRAFRDLKVRVGSGPDAHYWSVSGQPFENARGKFAGYRGHGFDVTEERRRELEQEAAASYDSLTGLANRARMEQRLTGMLAAFQQNKRSCALLMIDLDRFKHVNDTLGHAAGDDLLKQVADRLSHAAGEHAEVGRLGGDEFQIIIPDQDDRGKLGEIGQRIIALLSQPFVLDGSRAVIGGSVGIAIAPYDGMTREDLTHNADLALYAAKHGGRGVYRFYASDLRNTERDRKGIEADLGTALENGEFELNYQPILAAKGNRVVALEALLRWYHPERGAVHPNLFIPIAEDSNLINGIGMWVLQAACAEAASWPRSIRLNINISSVQLVNEGFPALVANALAQSGLEPERLELEINEKIFLHDVELIDEALARLRDIGVRLALDDFGAGMSSLGYLKSAHFDTLKIDPEFLRDACAPHNRNGDLIRALVALANALGMDSVAEAVEAKDELALVTQCGVTHIQGFIYEPPMDRDEMREKVASGEWIIEPDGPQKQRAERRRVFRKINLIHEDHFYEVMMRDLSRTGAMTEGLADVPLGERFVFDFGEGQLAVATVVRSDGNKQGFEFEVPLVPDGAGGLCTRHRVSPYALAAAGMPLGMLPPGQYPLVGGEHGVQPKSMPKFAMLNEAAKDD